MKIDKRTLDMLCTLPDDSLWKMICAIGGASGFDLSKMNLSPKDLEKLRQAMYQMTDSDISRASEILDGCKKKEYGHGQ